MRCNPKLPPLAMVCEKGIQGEARRRFLHTTINKRKEKTVAALALAASLESLVWREAEENECSSHAREERNREREEEGAENTSNI